MLIHFSESCPAIIISFFLIKSKVDRHPVTNPIPQRKSHSIMSRIFLCCFFIISGFVTSDLWAVRLCSALYSASQLFGCWGNQHSMAKDTKRVAVFFKISESTWRFVGRALPKTVSRSGPVNGPLVAAAGRYAYLSAWVTKRHFYLPLNDWLGFSWECVHWSTMRCVCFCWVTGSFVYLLICVM